MSSPLHFEQVDDYNVATLCKRGDLVGLQNLIVSKSITLDDLRSTNNYALRLACDGGHLPIVEYLMQLGLTVHDLRACNNYCLRWGCNNGHLPVVKYLITQGLTMDDFQDCDNLALRWACQQNHLEIVQVLIDHAGYTQDELVTLSVFPEMLENLVFSENILVKSASKW